MRRQERKNRDGFRKMLEEHVADGTLNARTRWRDYCAQVLELYYFSEILLKDPFLDPLHFTNPQIKDSQSYLAVASNTSGSTPKELFDDVIEELGKQVIFRKFCIYPCNSSSNDLGAVIVFFFICMIFFIIKHRLVNFR